MSVLNDLKKLLLSIRIFSFSHIHIFSNNLTFRFKIFPFSRPPIFPSSQMLGQPLIMWMPQMEITVIMDFLCQALGKPSPKSMLRDSSLEMKENLNPNTQSPTSF